MDHANVDLATLGAALAATGGGIVSVIAFIDKLRNEAAARVEKETMEFQTRIAASTKVCGEQIDEATGKQEWVSVARLRKVQAALLESSE